MWIKLCLLLVYICLLFVLSRLLETISWCDLGHSGVLSRQLLDPMRLSVAKLKCLLDYRGVSFEGIVEKSELTSLVETSGPVDVEDVKMSCEDEPRLSQTNFTSGAHFIEQVEDAKDSVWLVQVVTHTNQVQVVMNRRWKHIQRKASYFGVRTGLLDCSLDKRYCRHKGWKVPILLLALPNLFEKKANVIMYNYSGTATENAVMRWIHEKLDNKITRIQNMSELGIEQSMSSKSLQPELQAILFTQAVSAPLVFSALSVKFPGRVKFGLVTVNDKKAKKTFLNKLSGRYNVVPLPMCVIYTAERNYTYGLRTSERFSFGNMEIFLKFLYPCLNDIFILSFCVANVVSWFELFVSNCGLFKRCRKFLWCVLKYNLMVITLWLPVIGLFQMPYLDQIPLLLLKLNRIFTMSNIGAVLRGDYVFFINNPIYVYLSFVAYLVLVTLLCKKYREVEEDTEEWFNFRHMQTLTHLGANNLFDPRRISSYDLVGGFEVFGSRFSQQSLWLQPSIPLEYIQHLPTWRYTPQSMATRAAENSHRVVSVMVSANLDSPHSLSGTPSKLDNHHSNCGCTSKDCHCPEMRLSDEPPNVNLSAPTPSHHQHHMQASGMSSTSVCQSHGSQGHSKSCTFTTSYENDTKQQISNVLGQTTAIAGQSVEPGGISPSHQSDSACTARQTHPSANSSSPTALLNDIQEETQAADQIQPDILPSGFRKGFMESPQCVICLDDYVPRTMLCGLPCGHVFHEKCIISWLNREKHFCPMCRWPSYKLVTSQGP